jgi:transcriptional regulator with XRE-family HTH domain
VNIGTLRKLKQKTTKAGPPEDVSLSYLGQRIREIRRMKRQSLVQLASAAEISVAMLSHIERGETHPSLKSLERIRQALDVPMTRLFPHTDDDRPERRALPIVRLRDRELLEFPNIGLTKQKLSPNDESDLEVLLLVLEPGGSSGKDPWARVGEKAGLVVEGSMQLDIDGEVFDLEQGDSFQFDSSKPHRFANTGRTRAQIVWIIKSSPLVRKVAV